jgi:hypothetical protein
MGTQGSRGHVSGSRAIAHGSYTRLALTATSIIVTSFSVASLTLLTGCSSFSSSPSSAQTAAVPPPPNTAVAAPADEGGTSVYPYPKQSLIDSFRDGPDSSQPAQYVPRPPSAYTASGAPVAAGAPPPSAVNGASNYPYPQQSLLDSLRDSPDSSPRVQTAPHPPSTYTPSAQP